VAELRQADNQSSFPTLSTARRATGRQRTDWMGGVKKAARLRAMAD
jgi:hypothetical protein